jgi:(1->4)-alpha-D-glucan 1-alpha-D-glucosylmutase
VLDPNRISEELGGKDAFKALINEARALGLGWIQDIVPNHIAYSPESPMVSDLMKHGDKSPYRSFLDIDWNHPSPEINGKVLAPFLKENLGESLLRGQIQLAWHAGFVIKYGEIEFPVKISSYKDILSETSCGLPPLIWDESSLYQKMQELYGSDKAVRDTVNHEVDRYNQNAQLMEKLLSSQVYALENWKTAYKEIDYRRFFDILDLICLRMENENVFESTHRLVQWLISEGKVDGLRVDHVDGLYDPKEYLRRLRILAPKAFIIVEKILLNKEALPTDWSVQGSTGYDFLNKLNGLFVANPNEAEATEVYCSFTGKRETLDEVLYSCKKQVILSLFRGDVENLARTLQSALKETTKEVFTKHQAFEAVVELLCAFPVYRTYISSNPATNDAKRVLKTALETAKQRNGKLERELSALEKLLLGSALSDGMSAWIMRFQQYSGSVMAKGFEDTAFYRFNRSLSLNEVGGNPATFGRSTASFHSSMALRQTAYPMSLSASSTHDTKRGEDCRARLNVLSEIPSEFNQNLRKWSAANIKKKRKICSRLAPSRNEEYYIYQTLLGSFPFESAEKQEFAERLKTHLVKALREAKTNSNWLMPNAEYEEAVTAFASQLLESEGSNCFLPECLSFQRKIAFYGVFNSLSQTLIKIASPGIPDFYQGSELWNLSMVDPDNRRPVDFSNRQRMLKELEKFEPAKSQTLLNDFDQGKAKLYLITQALKTRKNKSQVFLEGEYLPLKVEGAGRNHVVAFCRKKADAYVVAVVPRFMATLNRGVERLPLGEVWKETTVCLPENAPAVWTEVFSGRKVSSIQSSLANGLAVADVLNIFPVGLLVSGEQNL